MEILHLLRSEPDELVNMFIQEVSKGKKTAEIPLYQGEIDYDRLIEEIFKSDRVISWW
jgi:hypothetical protein